MCCLCLVVSFGGSVGIGSLNPDFVWGSNQRRLVVLAG